MAHTDDLKVTLDREAARTAFLGGFEEGVDLGYNLAGGDAALKIRSLRPQLEALLEQYAGDRWTHAGVDRWARVASDVLGEIAKALTHDDEPEASALADVVAERARQNLKWGEQSHADGTGPESRPLEFLPALEIHGVDRAFAYEVGEWAKDAVEKAATEPGAMTWRAILSEEVFEAYVEDDPAKLRAELIQVAAVATQWAEAIDRRPAEESPAHALHVTVEAWARDCIEGECEHADDPLVASGLDACPSTQAVVCVDCMDEAGAGRDEEGWDDWPLSPWPHRTAEGATAA